MSLVSYSLHFIVATLCECRLYEDFKSEYFTGKLCLNYATVPYDIASYAVYIRMYVARSIAT